jgi:hypothetical protein
LKSHLALYVLAAFVPALAGTTGAVSALDLCVTCAGPEAHYNCRLDQPAANPRDLRLQLMCISQIATEGGHGSCAVDSPQPSACPGTLKTVAAPDALDVPPAAVAPAQKSIAAEMKPDDAKPAAPAETVIAKPPKTVQEMVEKGAATSAKGLETAGGAVKGATQSAGNMFQKAGSAVSNAVKKTWDCVTTLFGNC